MDVAQLGPPEPERRSSSSGLHGVQGFFGSAVQLAWLLRVPGWSAPPRTGLVMVHALNPFGFAWRRRWNESDVDLNRNFLDDREFLQADPNYRESRAAYDRLSAFLNPASSPSRWEPYSIKAVLRVMSAAMMPPAPMPRWGEPAPPRFAFKAGVETWGCSNSRRPSQSDNTSTRPASSTEGRGRRRRSGSSAIHCPNGSPALVSRAHRPAFRPRQVCRLPPADRR